MEDCRNIFSVWGDNFGNSKPYLSSVTRFKFSSLSANTSAELYFFLLLLYSILLRVIYFYELVLWKAISTTDVT
jgi:hypothetical protein